MAVSTWRVWCEILCYRCLKQTAGQYTTSKLNKPTMRNEALRNGWKLIHNEWICKDCIDELKEIQCLP